MTALAREQTARADLRDDAANVGKGFGFCPEALSLVLAIASEIATLPLVARNDGSRIRSWRRHASRRNAPTSSLQGA